MAEFILQVADEQPSHIIAPALHYSRERITALFKRKFHTDLPLDTGEELTRFAREILRQKFIAADAGISGANLIAADSGSLMLVESEGNIRMTTLLPPVHIAIAGIEKVVPSRTDFQPFIELLPASATGQPLTSYVSILTPPLDRAFVRRAGQEHCAARVSPRPDRQRPLGHARRPRVARGAVLHPLQRLLECLRQLRNCRRPCLRRRNLLRRHRRLMGGWHRQADERPLQRALYRMLSLRAAVPGTHRHSLAQSEPSPAHESGRRKFVREIAFRKSHRQRPRGHSRPLQKQFFANYHTFGKWGTRFASLANASEPRLPAQDSAGEDSFGVDSRRELPPFPAKTWEQLFQAGTCSSERRKPNRAGSRFWPIPSPTTDRRSGAWRRSGLAGCRRRCRTDTFHPGRTRRHVAGHDRHRPRPGARHGGDAAALPGQRQKDRRRRAQRAGDAALRLQAPARRPRHDRRAGRHELRAAAVAVGRRADRTVSIFRNCFQRTSRPWGSGCFTIRIASSVLATRHQQTIDVLRAAGFDVATSSVECCGMAGSFGYKHDYYDLSMAVGADLFAQVQQADEEGGTRVLVASGVSCHEQLKSGMGRTALHPAEVLESTLE